MKVHSILTTCAASALLIGGASVAGAQPAATSADASPRAAAPPSESGAADADAAESPDDAEPIDVVVTGKRKSEEPFLADRSVAVVGQKQLGEQQPRTTPEALWDVPGVFVQQTNHGGGSPIVRGLIGPQVLLMFDGVRLNNSTYRTGPLQYLNLIDPHSVSRMEVLRGPGSVLYGSDAMGGVIQLFPHEPSDSRLWRSPEVHGTSLVRYSSADNTAGAHAHAEVGVQGFGALAGGTLKSLDDLRGGRGVGVQPYSGYNDYTALTSLAYRFGDGALEDWHTKATYFVSRVDGAGRTDKLWDRQSLSVYDNELHLVYDRMHIEIAGLATTVDLTPSFQHFFERKDSIRVEEDLTTRLSAVRDEVVVNTFGLDAGLETTLVPDRLALRYGGMVYRDWVEAQRLERERASIDWVLRPDQSYPSGSTYDQYGAFILLEGAPVATSGGHRIQLRGGYRLHGMAGDAPALGSLPASEFSHLGHVFMGAAQYLYRDQATVAFSFTQGFRAPNLQEAVQLGDTGKFFHVPNDDLSPEQSNTFELLGRGKAWRLTAHWAAYVTLLEDLILRVPTEYEGQAVIDDKDVYHNVNGENGLLWGTEAGLGLDLGAGFSVNGQVSYAWGDEELPEGGTEPLSRIPPLFGLTSLRYDRAVAKHWRGFLETYVRWALRQDRLSSEDEADVRIPDDGTPGWWTWNVRAGLCGDGHHRFVLAVENLLDKSYKYHGSGVYAAGTNAIASYEASF